MFELRYARIHYGVSSYPMNNLPPEFQRLESPDSVRPEQLTEYVGRAYGYPREFTIRHEPRQELDLGGHPLVVDEHIVATANGYSFIWWRK